MDAERSELKLHVSTAVYPLEVIYRVCYQFTDNYYLWLRPDVDGVCVHITPKDSNQDPYQVKGEFGNALIDYSVRAAVAKETRQIRDCIVSTALAESLAERPDVKR